MRRALVEKLNTPFDLECDEIASDKSISHRCAIFSLLSSDKSRISNFLTGEDTLASLAIARELGAVVEREGSEVVITPPKEIREPSDILDCGNAGTAMRLYCGFLAGVEGSFVLTGDRYLRSRPMKRVVAPLRSIGANIDGRENGNLAPLHIRGASLEAFDYRSPIDSAQVKSAMILAALRADGESRYRESLLSRDHTERMLRGMGADIRTDGDGWIVVKPLEEPLDPLDISVPADPSSAFFFAVAAAITPGARVIFRGLTLNPTRVEAFRVLEKMGARMKWTLLEDRYEPIGDIEVSYNGRLEAVEVSEKIAWLIDELPALAIAMATAEGRSVVRNAAELRVKESDRISSVVEALKLCSIETREFEDGYEIVGGELRPAVIDSHGDHRIAMSFAIAGIRCSMEIEDVECVDTSFPNFFDILSRITKVEL